MNLRLETQLSDQIARCIDQASGETKLTAANMANIDTPGYQALVWTSKMRCARRSMARSREESSA